MEETPLTRDGASSPDAAPRQDVQTDASVSTMQVQFASREGLLAYITDYSLSKGFAVVTHRSNLPRGQLWLRCDLGRSAGDASEASTERKRKRKAPQRQLNCPYRLYGRRLSDGTWLLKVQNPLHTHDLASGKHELEKHPKARRLSDAQKQLILQMTDQGARPAVILERLQEKFPNKPIKVQDVYNARNFIRTERLAGRTPFGDDAGTSKGDNSGGAGPEQEDRLSISDELRQLWATVAEVLPSWPAGTQTKFAREVRRLLDEYGTCENDDASRTT